MFWNREFNAGTRQKRRGNVALLLCMTVALYDSALGSSATNRYASRNGTDTWAVIVNSSRFWLNYRHTANALGLYRSLKMCVGVSIMTQRDGAVNVGNTYYI